MCIRRQAVIATLLVSVLLAGCGQRIGDYTSVSSFSRDGFARSAKQARSLNGRELAVWGYVDYGNMYGDAAAKGMLGQWWSGEGPDSSAWAFNVKTGPDVPVGRSFQVRVPNDSGRDELLRAFAANATAGRPTQVFLRGKMHTFDAPTGGGKRTGLYMEVESSQEISLQPSGGR
jgi:hypothetical protein